MNKRKAVLQEEAPVVTRLDAARLTVGAVVLVLGWPGRYRLIEVNARGWWFVPVDMPDMQPFRPSSGAAKVFALAATCEAQEAAFPLTPYSEEAMHKSNAAIDAHANYETPVARRGRGRPPKNGVPISRATRWRRQRAGTSP